MLCEKCIARSPYQWAGCPLRLTSPRKFRKGVNKDRRGCSEFTTDQDVWKRIRNHIDRGELCPSEVPYAMTYAQKHDKEWYKSYFDRRWGTK